VKIAYFGLDLGLAVLQTLLDHGQEVVSVHYSLDEDGAESRLANLARTSKIPVSAERPTTDTFAKLLNQEIDLVLVNGYPHRLPIESTTLKGVNMHPTLLPEGRGPWPFPWTILKGLQQSGVTTHKLTDTMDAGDILLQTVYPVEANETFDSLVAKYQIAAPRHILQLLDNFVAFWDNATPQVGGSNWPDTTRDDCTLEWSWSINELSRTVRAFGSSGCFAKLNGAPLLIRSVESWPSTPLHAPGAIVPEAAPALVVAVADGYLLIRDYVYE
jgi:methionyl-tRNA formyltransferase